MNTSAVEQRSTRRPAWPRTSRTSPRPPGRTPRRPPRGARRGRPGVPSEGALGEEPVDGGVAVVDPDLHAAAQPGVAVLEGVAQARRVQAGGGAPPGLPRERLPGGG